MFSICDNDIKYGTKLIKLWTQQKFPDIENKNICEDNFGIILSYIISNLKVKMFEKSVLFLNVALKWFHR